MPIFATACARSAPEFPGEYWRALDRERAYPTEFVTALTKAGYLAALIPEQYGGSGLNLAAAAAIMEENTRLRWQWRGLSCADVHDGYDPAFWQRHAERTLPSADRERRTSTASVRRGPQPTSGTDTLSLRTVARREGNDHYVINGQKIWTSRAEHWDLYAAARKDDAKRADQEAHGGPVGFLSGYAARARRQYRHQSDPNDDEPCDHADIFRRPARAGRTSHR